MRAQIALTLLVLGLNAPAAARPPDPDPVPHRFDFANYARLMAIDWDYVNPRDPLPPSRSIPVFPDGVMRVDGPDNCDCVGALVGDTLWLISLLSPAGREWMTRRMWVATPSITARATSTELAVGMCVHLDWDLFNDIEFSRLKVAVVLDRGRYVVITTTPTMLKRRCNIPSDTFGAMQFDQDTRTVVAESELPVHGPELDE